jgi:hypothetical protein
MNVIEELATFFSQTKSYLTVFRRLGIDNRPLAMPLSLLESVSAQEEILAISPSGGASDRDFLLQPRGRGSRKDNVDRTSTNDTVNAAQVRDL